MYKPSNYNIFEHSNDGSLLVMNMLSQKHIKLDKSIATIAYSTLQNTNSAFELSNPWLSILAKNGFIISTMFDEAKWIEMKHNETVFGDNFLSVTILPTNDCNFRCQYCYETPAKDYMTDESEERVLKFFQREIPKVRRVRLAWFGGEPLLAKDTVLRISKEVDELCKKSHIPMIGTMNTNGYLLDVDTFKRLISMRVLSYEICLDGPEYIHNIQRPHYENKDSYRTVINNLVKIKEQVKSGVYQIVIRCNVTPLVEDHLEEHLTNLSKIFEGDTRFHITFQGVRNWGGNRIHMSDIPTSETSIQKKWFDFAANLNLTSAEGLSLDPFLGYCEGNRKNGYIINYDGTLHKCTIAMYDEDSKDVDSIGYIDKYGRSNIDEGKLAKWLVRSSPIKSQCMKCSLFPVCVGGCCFYQLNIKNQPNCNPIQELAKAQLRCMDLKGMLQKVGENNNE